MGRWSPALILLLAAPSLRAQDKSPRLELSLAAQVTAGVDAPTVALANTLSEGHRRELLHIIQRTNLQGVPIYTKGKLVAESGLETYYFRVSSKRAE